MEIPQEIKDNMKAQRLREYQMKIFNFQMDIAAGESVGDQEFVKESKKKISELEKAYQAVEAL